MPAPCPRGSAAGRGQGRLQLSQLGWSCPTELLQAGLSQTDGDRWVWGPTELLLHIWPHVALSAAPQVREVMVAPWYKQQGLGLGHSQVEVLLLLGTAPCSWR